MGTDTRSYLGGYSLSQLQFFIGALVVGAVLFVGHSLLFPPGYFSEVEYAWFIIGFSGCLAVLPGYVGIGPLFGISGASMPGIALALRGEIINFYHGCFEDITGTTNCSDPGVNVTEYLLRAGGLALGTVVAAALIGYTVGASARHIHHRVTQ